MQSVSSVTAYKHDGCISTVRGESSSAFWPTTHSPPLKKKKPNSLLLLLWFTAKRQQLIVIHESLGFACHQLYQCSKEGPSPLPGTAVGSFEFRLWNFAHPSWHPQIESVFNWSCLCTGLHSQSTSFQLCSFVARYFLVVKCCKPLFVLSKLDGIFTLKR